MKIRPVLFAFLLSVSCFYAKAVSEEESDTANNEIDQNTESSEPEEQPDPLEKLSRLEPFLETSEFNYSLYLQEPEDERVLIGTNTPLYIAKYDEETEKIKYRAYHYPEPQTKNSCKKEQHQKLSPKEHVESEKTYHEHEDTVYPEILVVVDYSLYKKYGGNVFKIAQVAAAYWNSVDLLYRTIKNPKIRLNIAGLIIPESPEAIPYVEKNYNHNLGSFDDIKVIEDMTSHFENYGKHLDGIPEHSFDTVILMTNRLNLRYVAGLALPSAKFGKDTIAFVSGDFENHFYTVIAGAHEQGHL
ncbi:venom metalloproteinase 2-like [Trichogramma pretiosum]|uniref:venom metalloproteinase 2-like n=1 Tax=Trichogramma pretiosum TaxID=7493 RepID=UPI000C71B377|nr:venom metalloproteinase 2-like [Trichogramma pretiosum]